MQESTYTLIAYKPNSSSSCCGHISDWYNSGFSFNTDLNREELVVKWYQRRDEADYDFIVMKDGKVIYDTIDYMAANDEPEIQDILSDAKQLLSTYLTKAAENKHKQEELEAQRKVGEKNNSDRSLYEKLKKQFEPNED